MKSKAQPWEGGKEPNCRSPRAHLPLLDRSNSSVYPQGSQPFLWGAHGFQHVPRVFPLPVVLSFTKMCSFWLHLHLCFVQFCTLGGEKILWLIWFPKPNSDCLLAHVSIAGRAGTSWLLHAGGCRITQAQAAKRAREMKADNILLFSLLLLLRGRHQKTPRQATFLPQGGFAVILRAGDSEQEHAVTSGFSVPWAAYFLLLLKTSSALLQRCL